MDFARLDQHRIAYWTEGVGVPVLLVHGSFSTSSAWKRLVAHLDKNVWHVVAPDLPGWGESAALPDDVEPVEFEAMAVEAVAKQVTSGPIHLAGHSSGGTVALAIALRGRVPVQSLTLFEPTPVSILAYTGSESEFNELSEFVSTYRIAVERGDKWAAAPVIDLWGGKGTFDAMPAAVREFIAANTAQNLRSWQGGFAFRPALDALAKLQAPTTLVQGALSHRFAKLLVTRLREFIPRSTVVELKDAAHFMIQTHPGESARLIGQPVDA